MKRIVMALVLLIAPALVAACDGGNAGGGGSSSGTTTGIQWIHVVSSPVSERLLSVAAMIVLVETVMLALLPSGETSNAMKDSLIDVGRSTA